MVSIGQVFLFVFVFVFPHRVDHDRLRKIPKGVQLIILKIGKQKESLKLKKMIC